MKDYEQHEAIIMKLFYSSTSPYSRKVRMMIHEKGLQQAITSVACNPFDEVPELKAANPLGKVPTLILNDGASLYDSPVICAYLDTLTPDRLIPESGPDTNGEHWNVLRWEALCDGVLDATYNIVMERRRDNREQSAGWIEQWKNQVSRSLDHMETDVDTLPEHVTLAQLSLGAALGYLDFRLSDLDWRSHCPALTTWHEEFDERDTMQNTRPE